MTASMAFAPQAREPPRGLPSMKIPGSSHLHRHYQHDDDDYSPHRLPISRSAAMSIPGSGAKEHVPPPLPPPRVLPLAGAPYQPRTLPPTLDRRDHDHIHGQDHGVSIDSGYGSSRSALSFKPLETHFSESSYRTLDDRPLPSRIGLSHSDIPLESPADRYSASMKMMLNPCRGLDKSPRSPRISPNHDLLKRSPFEKMPIPPPPPSSSFQIPFRSRKEFDVLSTTSSHSLSETDTKSNWLQPMRTAEAPEAGRSPETLPRRKYSDDASTTASCDSHGGEELDAEGTSLMVKLQIGETSQSVGQKRKATWSPVAGTIWEENIPRWRQEGDHRGSPVPRMTTTTKRASSHVSQPASESGGSRPGLPSPSRTPDRLSPKSCTTSPHGHTGSIQFACKVPLNSGVPAHSRDPSRNGYEVSRVSGLKVQGYFMCECCPKKPKRFSSSQALRAHEAEKQYECQFCGNRFKNKNEAERHQNSLHVRSHSWSCSALSGYDAAFHESIWHTGEADSCGFCGEDFPRSGSESSDVTTTEGVVIKRATELDWDQRIRHLQEVHKFGECNSSKKFYRADHFRQHLKHSHAGTSGKWTNMLEDACMVEEDPKPPIVGI